MLEQAAFDIETTGFDISDEVTVVGFAMPMGVRVFVQTAGRTAGDVEASVKARLSERLVNDSTHTDEAALLSAVATFVRDRIQDTETLLIAFNGEVWSGGFDLPFLRSRYAACEMAWPFDVAYADVLPVVSDRFNTTVDGEEQRGLALSVQRRRPLVQVACNAHLLVDANQPLVADVRHLRSVPYLALWSENLDAVRRPVGRHSRPERTRC